MGAASVRAGVCHGWLRGVGRQGCRRSRRAGAACPCSGSLPRSRANPAVGRSGSMWAARRSTLPFSPALSSRAQARRSRVPGFIVGRWAYQGALGGWGQLRGGATGESQRNHNVIVAVGFGDGPADGLPRAQAVAAASCQNCVASEVASMARPPLRCTGATNKTRAMSCPPARRTATRIIPVAQPTNQ